MYIAPLQDTYSEALPTQAKPKQSLGGGGIENRHRLEGALDLLEVHSRCLDQPQKFAHSALSQSGRMGPPNYREQRTGVHDGLNMRSRAVNVYLFKRLTDRW